MRDLFSPRNSVIHQLDARVKFIFTLAFIFFLNLTPTRAWAIFVLFLTIILLLALLSRLGPGFVVKRSLLATPFLLAVLPLIFTAPPPYFKIELGDTLRVLVSQEGLLRFLSIALRAWISVMAAVLLVATTRFSDLMNALHQLKVPELFIAIISLMWRYLFVMVEEVRRMLHARSSRSASARGRKSTGGTLIWRIRVTGGMAGNLFLRSIERSERVYAAMLARGYTGTLPASERIPVARKDLAVLVSGLLLLLALWGLSLFIGR